MNLTIFDSPDFGQVRVVNREGAPFFAAKDVAVALGYMRPADAVTDHCKGVVVLPTPTAGGPHSPRSSRRRGSTGSGRSSDAPRRDFGLVAPVLLRQDRGVDAGVVVG